MKKINHFINGKEYISKSDRFGDIFNPASGEKIGSVSFANKIDVALRFKMHQTLKRSGLQHHL